MKKKLVTGLLIGATLSSVVSTNAFAASNRTISQLLGRSSVQIEYPYTTIPEIGTYYKSTNFNKQGISGTAYRVNYSSYYFIWSSTNGKLYLYNSSNDKFLVGRVKSGKDIYYFNEDRHDPYAKTEWQTINGLRYYFKPRTYNAVRSDFLQLYNNRYYFNDWGELRTGFFNIGPKRYYALGSGLICSGFYSFPNSDRCYFDPDNNDALTTGWKLYNNKWMHFNENGVMSRGITRIDDISGHHGYYLFTSYRDGNAYQASGYYTDPNTNKRYLFDGPDGKARTSQWYNTAGVNYLDSSDVYFTEDGSMAQGVTLIGSDKYLFTQNRKRDNNWYKTFGWYTDKSTGYRYYFDPKNGGKAAKNTILYMDGRHYEFNWFGNLLATY